VLYSMALKESEALAVGNGREVTVVTGDDDDDDDTSVDEALSTIALPPPSSYQVLHQQQYYDEDGNDNVDGEPLLYMVPVSVPALCQTFQEVLFQSQGQLGANLILGGVWQRQPYLRAIHPHGSMDVGLPFAALGSGGLAAMSVLEEGYTSHLSLDEGIALVQKAILSGIRNDLGSGSQVDLCIIAPDGSSRHMRCVVPEETLDDVIFDTEKEPANGDSNSKGTTQPPFLSSGVNGFGNIPFAIQSARQRVISIEADESRHNALWDDALGQ
jgi:Proteasome subunit